MSASLPPKPKRPLSPAPADTTIRRVRQRTGTHLSSTVKVIPKKRDESPEEGEVEDEGEIPSVANDDGALNGAPSANGTANGTGSREEELKKEKAAAAGEKPKKVAFPFKSRAQKVQAIPTVDMENGASRPAIPQVSPNKGEYTRGGSGSRHGFEENGVGAGARDSYVPQHSRGYDSYVPSRDRGRESPKAAYERRRSWSPTHRDDGPDSHRRGRSRSPVETWDTYIAPKYQDPSGRMHKGRLADTYIAPGEGSPNQHHWQRSSSRGRGPGGADYYRPHVDSPPRDRSPPERGAYFRSGQYSPGPAPHRLPPRPPSPDRYVPPRHDDRPWNHSSRDQNRDHGYYPPRTPTRTPPQPHFEPPPLPAGEMGVDGLPPRPRISFSRGGDGAAVLLQQQQKQQPFLPGPRPPVPPVTKPQAVYTRPPPSQVPAPPPAPLIEPKAEMASPPPNERQEKSKASKHKVARVRTRDEERTAYGREFVGSGRIKDYILLNKLGEGTFGEVHRAQLQKPEPGKPVRDLALKRIIMHSEKDGMPITALREIKILKALSHPNIVPVLDIVVQPRTPSAAGSVFMVFPYMDHDLAGLLENKAVQLAQSHIKLYMKQLLEGLEYMHENHIIHRDIKAANILISNEGVLQIADFGLARAYVKKTKQERIEEGKKRGRPEKYTNCVVTRWYRPPELLLGERLYGAEIDLWGIGCILAEMFVRRPILQGQSDMDQLEKIWWLCGTPSRDTWPDFDSLPGLDGVKDFKPREKSLRKFLGRFDSITRETMDLIEALLSLDPTKRPTASEALLHDYFWTTPLPADPKTMPKYEASHELDRRRKEVPPAPPPNPHQHSYQFQGPHGHGGPFNHFNRGGGGGRGMPMGRGGGPMHQQHQQRPFHQGPPGMQGPGPGPHPMGPMGMGHIMTGPPGLPPHPGMHGLPPPHGGPFPPHMNQQHPGLPPPPIPPPNTNGGLPVPRGFRPPPPPRAQYQQPPYPGPGPGPGGYNGRPPGPNNGPPPPGMGGPPRDRGPPPSNDSMVLHYG